MNIHRLTVSTEIEITLEDRPDGGLRVYSDDLPGLNLSSNDRQSVLNDIKPAVEMLMSDRLGVPVTVQPSSGGHDKPTREYDFKCIPPT